LCGEFALLAVMLRIVHLVSIPNVMIPGVRKKAKGQSNMDVGLAEFLVALNTRPHPAHVRY